MLITFSKIFVESIFYLELMMNTLDNILVMDHFL